jgi:Prp8 binding protein
VKRTSDLQAPIVMLTGHEGPVTSVTFAPGGAAFATGSFDGNVFLWATFGDNVNYGVLKGHHKAVLSVKWGSDGANVFSSSADCSAKVWDSDTFECIRTCSDHGHIVSEVSLNPNEPSDFATACDDGVVRLWDLREEAPTASIEFPYQVLSVALSGSHLVFCGGIDNEISAVDTRFPDKVLFTLAGHREAVTSCALSQDGSYLLSNARDNTVRIWDAKPFSARANRCLKIFSGATHNAENNLIRASWSPDGSMICAGSADRFVYVWSTTTREILYKLPGHRGVVNQVAFHPTQPIIASVSADRAVYLGEIDVEGR